MEAYEDPHHELNSPKYHTGKKCIEKGCNNPAGTHWSPFWCQPCNANRFNRITSRLEAEVHYRRTGEGYGAMTPEDVAAQQRFEMSQAWVDKVTSDPSPDLPVMGGGLPPGPTP